MIYVMKRWATCFILAEKLPPEAILPVP